MGRSKLEIYETILEALIDKPLHLDELSYETDIECTCLNKYLDFLMQNGLTQERIFGTQTVHAITERGTAVIKTLNFQKYLNKISSVLVTMEEATKLIPNLAKHAEPDDGR